MIDFADQFLAIIRFFSSKNLSMLTHALPYLGDNEILTGLCKIMQVLRNLSSADGLNNWRHESTPEVVDEWKRLL